VLQQRLHIKHNHGQDCSSDDEQRQWSKDHQEMQDARLQIHGYVQKKGHHKHHMSQEPYQVL
jgi:hypothetical protein